MRTLVLALACCGVSAADSLDQRVLSASCTECHDADNTKGGLDLTKLAWPPADQSGFARWVKIFDRVNDGEMPLAKSKTPLSATDRRTLLDSLGKRLTSVDQERQKNDGRTPLRRLNRIEFEHSVRDLLALPGLRLRQALPEDGKSHGFDRLAGALDFSSIHLRTYLSVVDKALDAALCPLPEKPEAFKARFRVWDKTIGNRENDGWVGLMLRTKTGIGISGQKLDPSFSSTKGDYHVEAGPDATAVGIFRNEDADWGCSFRALRPVLTGWHRLRVSGYSFGWDAKQQQVAPTDRGGVLSWAIGNVPLGIVGLPPNKAAVVEVTAWMERGEAQNWNEGPRIIPASTEYVRDARGTLGPDYAAPGVAIEWIEIEGPIIDQWPPASHRALFGNLAVKTWSKDSGVPLPKQQTWPNGMGSVLKDPYGERGDKRPLVYVDSAAPLQDGARLLQTFARRAFRRPVAADELAPVVEQLRQRIAAGAAFQDALVMAYRELLTSPDFMLLREPVGPLSAHALASRLSYFLWSSLPDDELSAVADSGALLKPEVLRAQTERLLKDRKAARFTENFLGQWLSLRAINATQPDKGLHPEYLPLLAEAMVMESHAFFNELLTGDLGVTNLVKSDFAMLNEPLARHYGIPGVSGWEMRAVKLPVGSHRGGVLTQAAVLKVTAAGTTTSPVKRGAFVMERLLGITPEAPPADAGAIEPDVSGAVTVREQLEKHRRNSTCNACHAKMDGYGFALESFDVTGQWRDRYRSIGGTAEEHKPVVNANHIAYHFATPVDCRGAMPDGRTIADVDALRDLLVADPERLARAFTNHLITYATGAEISFADRAAVDAILRAAKAKQYGIRTLVHEIIQSALFRTK